MVALLLTTTISCSQALAVIDRVTKVVGLTTQQRIEIIQVIKEYIPTCPIQIKKDGK